MKYPLSPQNSSWHSAKKALERGWSVFIKGAAAVHMHCDEDARELSCTTENTPRSLVSRRLWWTGRCTGLFDFPFTHRRCDGPYLEYDLLYLVDLLILDGFRQRLPLRSLSTIHSINRCLHSQFRRAPFGAVVVFDLLGIMQRMPWSYWIISMSRHIWAEHWKMSANRNLPRRWSQILDLCSVAIGFLSRTWWRAESPVYAYDGPRVMLWCHNSNRYR